MFRFILRGVILWSQTRTDLQGVRSKSLGCVFMICPELPYRLRVPRLPAVELLTEAVKSGIFDRKWGQNRGFGGSKTGVRGGSQGGGPGGGPRGGSRGGVPGGGPGGVRGVKNRGFLGGVPYRRAVFLGGQNRGFGGQKWGQKWGFLGVKMAETSASVGKTGGGHFLVQNGSNPKPEPFNFGGSKTGKIVWPEPFDLAGNDFCPKAGPPTSPRGSIFGKRGSKWRFFFRRMCPTFLGKLFYGSRTKLGAKNRGVLWGFLRVQKWGPGGGPGGSQGGSNGGHFWSKNMILRSLIAINHPVRDTFNT